MSNQIKFHTHHFPVGTLFRLKETVCFALIGEDLDEVFEVKDIVRNGEQSFCIRTTTADESFAFKGSDMLKSYNIVHVREIVKRGDGDIVIRQQYHDHIDQMIEHTFDSLDCFRRAALNAASIKIKKTDICFTDGYEISTLAWLYSQLDDSCMTMCDRKVLQLFYKSALSYKRVQVRGYGNIYIVNKKRFKKWVMQNRNRFLTSVSKAQKESDDAMNEALDRAFDSYIDDKYPETVDKSQDSCYVDDYDSYVDHDDYRSKQFRQLLTDSEQAPTDDGLINKIDNN